MSSKRSDEEYGDFLDALASVDGFLSARQRSTRPTPGEATGAVPDPSLLARDLDDDGPEVGARAQARDFPLNRRDPDVRRLLESIAFFSARTKRLAVDGLQRAVDRVNAGHFEFILDSLPAKALVRAIVAAPAKPSGTKLPRGTALRITTATGAVGMFSTTRALTVWPLSIATMTPPTLRSGGGCRLILDLTSTSTAKGARPQPVQGVQQLSLHVNYEQDYSISRRIAGLLKDGIRVRVSFSRRLAMDTEVPDDAVECRAYVGAPRDLEAPEEGFVDHPLQRVRSFFQVPAADLFLNIVLPVPPAGWSQASIYIDLTRSWPGDLDLSDDTFQLFVVPAVNLRRAQARPISCDGTKESYPIEGTNPAAQGSGKSLPGEDTRLHSVAGVYKLTPRGLEPLQSALVSAGEWSYEILSEGQDPDRLRHRLLLQCPSALASPQTIVVDARWYQPAFDASAVGLLTVGLQSHAVAGVTFALARNLLPHSASPLFGEPFRLLHLLGLRTQTRLNFSQIMQILEILGLDEDSAHAPVLALVADITAREASSADAASGAEYVYDVTVRTASSDEEEDLLDDFREQLHTTLDAWLPGPVEVRMTPLPSTKVQLPSGGSA